MKKTILIAVLFAAAARAEPSGNYLTWMGFNAGNNGSGNYSTMYGAYSGAASSDLQGTSFMGVMSGYHAWSVYDAIGLGFRALQDSQDCTNVYAIGRNAGRDAYNNANCLFIGPGAGRGAENLVNCVLIGESAGYEEDSVTNRTYINGQFYADSASGSFYIRPTPGTDTGALTYSNGVLKISGNEIPSEASIRNKLTSGNMRPMYSYNADVASALSLNGSSRNADKIISALDAAVSTNASQTSSIRSLNSRYYEMAATITANEKKAREKTDMVVYTNGVMWVWENGEDGDAGVEAATMLNELGAYPVFEKRGLWMYPQTTNIFVSLMPETFGDGKYEIELDMMGLPPGENSTFYPPEEYPDGIPSDPSLIDKVRVLIFNNDTELDVVVVGRRLAGGIPSSDRLASTAVVTNIVRDLSLGGIWDSSLQVWWTPRMQNGRLTYCATTNVNLNAGN